MKDAIKIFTDGSAHTQIKTGAWAAIVITDKNEQAIKGSVHQTTHNRMEMLAVINGINYVIENAISFDIIKIYTDSQFVEKIEHRKEKLKANNFITKKGQPLGNSDLIKRLIELIEQYPVEFIKVKAHQKDNSDLTIYNNKVDAIVKGLMQESIKKK